MVTNLYHNKYLISIVEPVDAHGVRQPLRVDVYEHLDPVDNSHLGPTDLSVKHMQWIQSFPLSDRFGENTLSLDEIISKVNELHNTRKTSGA